MPPGLCFPTPLSLCLSVPSPFHLSRHPRFLLCSEYRENLIHPSWTEGINSRGRLGWEPDLLPASSLQPGTGPSRSGGGRVLGTASGAGGWRVGTGGHGTEGQTQAERGVWQQAGGTELPMQARRVLSACPPPCDMVMESLLLLLETEPLPQKTPLGRPGALPLLPDTDAWAQVAASRQQLGTEWKRCPQETGGALSPACSQTSLETGRGIDRP